MKKPFMLLPVQQITIPHNSNVQVYKDNIFTIEMFSQKDDASHYQKYSFWFKLVFDGEYKPDSRDVIYAISENGTAKISQMFMVENDEPVFLFCFGSMDDYSTQIFSESYTLKWISNGKIYSVSIGMQHFAMEINEDSSTVQVMGSGHINGSFTVGENPFETEGV